MCLQYKSCVREESTSPWLPLMFFFWDLDVRLTCILTFYSCCFFCPLKNLMGTSRYANYSIQLDCFQETTGRLISYLLSRVHSYAEESTLTAAANLAVQTTYKAALIYSHRKASHSVICWLLQRVWRAAIFFNALVNTSIHKHTRTHKRALAHAVALRKSWERYSARNNYIWHWVSCSALCANSV